MSKILAHRNYKMIAESNLEAIRGDIWDLNFTKWPSAVYNPGEDLLKVRLNAVTPGANTESLTIDKTILGFQIHSPGGRGATNGSSAFNFIDREDQAVTYMILDYLTQSGDPDTSFGRHKTELIMEYNLLFYNTLLKPVRKLEFYTALYDSSTLPNDTTDRGGDLSDVSLSVKFEHHLPFIL